jgi:polyprenyl-phospho-N-acetylgalactosaminyl synthase
MNMNGNTSIFVVIPAYNEQAVIAETVKPLVAAGYKVLVVDDGSLNSIKPFLQNLPVVVLRHPLNLGQGAALQTGMDYAFKAGAEIVVHFDADGQHDADQIPSMVSSIRNGEVDVVLGSRFLRASDLNQIPLAKRMVLRVGRIFSGLMTGMWLSDTHNGFRALSRRALERIHLHENGFAHATEILYQIKKAELRYIEVPTCIRYTEYARAKGQPMTNSLKIVFDVILRKLFP